MGRWDEPITALPTKTFKRLLILYGTLPAAGAIMLGYIMGSGVCRP